jgi:hypothetical protein
LRCSGFSSGTSNAGDVWNKKRSISNTLTAKNDLTPSSYNHANRNRHDLPTVRGKTVNTCFILFYHVFVFWPTSDNSLNKTASSTTPALGEESPVLGPQSTNAFRVPPDFVNMNAWAAWTASSFGSISLPEQKLLNHAKLQHHVFICVLLS